MKQLFSRPFWPFFLIVVALAAAITTSWWLLQQWHQQQTALQIQLLNSSASLLSIRPLQQKQPAALQVTLLAIQQHSALPIRAMAVFDQSQKVFASTSNSERWLEQAAQSLDPEQFEFSDPGVQLISTPVWADRTITDSSLSEHNDVPAPAISSRQLGYLLVLIESPPTPALRILSPFLLLMLMVCGLIWLGIKQIKQWQRIQIEQFTLQLQLDNVKAGEEDPTMQPLVQAWFDKSKYNQQQAEEEMHDLQRKMTQLDGQFQASQQTTALLSGKQQQLLEQLQASSLLLEHWQQLASNAASQSSSLLVRQLKLLSLYTRLNDPDFILQPDAILMPDWLQNFYNGSLQEPDSTHLFVFDEDPQAYAFRVNIDPILLANLLELFVFMCKKLATEPEIIFSYRLLEVPSRQLKINMKYIGPRFPVHWCQRLTVTAEKIMPNDMDAEVSRSILQWLNGSLQIDSIDDLGTQLEILVPVSWQKTNTAKSYQSILLVDEKECRLPLAKQSLAAIGEQVHSCPSYSQLNEMVQRRLVDLLVLVLPDHPTQLAVTVDELNALSQRYSVQALAKQDSVAQWQSLLSFPVRAMPLLIGQLSEAQPQSLALQQLLVVDDNLTNLSYVRAVLALEGLGIDIAMTGDEAIKLATNNRYQLILMDIQLPDLPGTEVTKQIRQLRHHQQTVILAFTAHALPDEIASFRLAGMDDVLIKPLDTQKIAHILGRIKALDQS